jgi:lipopolysaccharide export system permease protein
MLFQSSLRKELSRTFGATLVILVTVVLTMTLIRTLGQASRGSFNPSDVTLVMGYTVLAYTPTLLSMSLFIAIIGTLSRMYRESEMVIWFCSGRGLAALLAPLFRFSWPIFGVIAVLALVVLPWTNQRIDNLKNQYEKRGDIERVEPGQFQESANGSRVFFIEKNNTGQRTGANVFIATNEAGKETITSARSGRIDTLPQGRFLMLNNGQRLETLSGTTDIKVSEFEAYGTQVTTDPFTGTDPVFVNTRPTLELIRNPSSVALAELSWRFGLILAAFNFVIIGVALSSVNPRVGKNINLVFALFAFIFYFNLLNLGQNWVGSEKVSLGIYLIALHGGIFALACLWLAKGHNNWSWHTLVVSKQSSTSNRGTVL